jgi:methylase of polypeptide subunit release factors
VPSKRERATAERFTQRYGESHGDIRKTIEVEVIGASVGVNGYTTIAQADRLARELRLGPGMRLLDLGAGNGWPGIYLSKATGCRAILADVPRPALASALRRSQRQRIARRVGIVQSTATALPFAPASFDAIVHTDVMC